jgi:hypothetical protein
VQDFTGDEFFINRLSAARADRLLSMQETAGPVSAKIKDHSKEREVRL